MREEEKGVRKKRVWDRARDECQGELEQESEARKERRRKIVRGERRNRIKTKFRGGFKERDGESARGK